MELVFGEGGQDSKLFVNDLMSAYIKYGTSKGFGAVDTKLGKSWKRFEEKRKKVEAVRTAGGHRRYRVSEIEKLQGIEHEEVEKLDKEVIVQYSRVSSHEQKAKGDPDRQSTRLSKYAAEKGYHVAHVLTDVGSVCQASDLS